jgi:DNA-binding response OmpR family regulator
MMRSSTSTILLVEDEQTVREVVRKYLERDHFRVLEATNGADALHMIRECQPNLIVLDIMLPEIDGFDVIRTLRELEDPEHPHLSNTPIIVLSARREEVDRIFGFQLGIDDYVVKPFSPMELVARIIAVLRRSEAAYPPEDKGLTYHGLHIDARTHQVTLHGQSITLTAKEFDLLLFLTRHPGQVFSRTQLIEQIWGHEFAGAESTVTVHIRRLREKIEPDPTDPLYIQTVYGVGYRFGDV